MKYEILTIRFVSVTAGPSCVVVWLVVVVDCHRTPFFKMVLGLATEQNATREKKWRWTCSMSILAGEKSKKSADLILGTPSRDLHWKASLLNLNTFVFLSLLALLNCLDIWIPMHHNSVSSQSTISSYFQSATQQPHPGKRTTIDLTVGDEGYEPPLKRPRTSGHRVSTPPIRGEVSPKKAVPSVADGWRFSPEKSQAGPSRPRTSEEKARHEAFKKKLLSDNSQFLKKPEITELDYEPMDEGNTEVNEDSGDESDRFQKLSEMFSHEGKSRGKAKGKSTGVAKHVQKTVEVGPSGQSYTPLEKQVCSLYLRKLFNTHRHMRYRSSS